MSDKFQSFWIDLEPPEKLELAERADTSVSYLSQIANGHRNAGVDTIRKLTAADERISLSMFFDAA